MRIGFISGVNEMSTNWIHGNAFGSAKAVETTSADLLVATCLAAAAQGDVSSYYDLGVAYSTGSHGVDCDLVEATSGLTWLRHQATARRHCAALTFRKR